MPLGLQIPAKLLPFVSKKKRYKVAFGGRGGSKSMSFADMLSMKAQTEGALVGCLREYQNSIEDSVFALLKEEIIKLKVPGFKNYNNKIEHTSGGGFRFRGLARSIDAIKSMFGFKYFWLEEGQFISEDSLRILTPTLREKDSELWISANPMSKADPFSQRFIEPYKKEIDKYGFYEDELHYIVKINHSDNPWFPPELEAERQNDYISLPRALYDHIWEGEYNDSVQNALINAKWFDACVDAHLILGFEPLGIRVSSHDPSDEGEDSKGYAFRHGSVVLQVEENVNGDINEGCDWATGLAINNVSDAFIWDCDGVGIGLNRQVSQALSGKNVRLVQYKGSETPEAPESIYEPIDTEKSQILSAQNMKKNKEVFKNLRVQKYFELRNRIYRTYEAVVKKKYSDPENLISFSSGITELTKLRSELCRIPTKPNSNGMLDLYSKPEMKRKFKIASPNLADSVKMLWKTPKMVNIGNVVRPRPIRVIGSTYRDQQQRQRAIYQ